eukprot:Protomagalhaensia_wolfi_Nauph_80__6169@NODE_907_length_1895_cov_24_383082_g683_i0_p2_GENE_NODE_907_length_1895_cov_24_383082_g683_i0NODE_907_length_1895_cov_24_383082_g683_i0_p2_ORF_typecomplete_len127_score8_29Rad10/PF03834_14/0_22Glyco_trans_1_3/PF13528_6/0_19Orbi_VP6/PF01516_16/0_23_NODE_907_length_1895_cov_24_383082_g683_i012581638
MGNHLILSGVDFEEEWVSGRPFSRRTIVMYLSSDLSYLWWDADMRYSCPVTDNKLCFLSWKQVLKTARLHPYLMSDQIRQLSEKDRRRLLVVETVDHNDTLRRHWFLSSSPRLAEDMVRCLSLLKG